MWRTALCRSSIYHLKKTQSSEIHLHLCPSFPKNKHKNIWSNLIKYMRWIKFDQMLISDFLFGNDVPQKIQKIRLWFLFGGNNGHPFRKKNKEKQLSSTIFSESTEALMPSTKLDQQERNLSWQFDLGKKIYRVFLDTFLWNDGAKKWKQEINVFLFFCVEGGLQSRKNSRKTWTFFGNCWGNDGH